MPVVFATVIGVAAGLGIAIFLQRNLCGLAADHWGPLEGLKGVPGWDAPGQDNTETSSPTPTVPEAPSVATDARAVSSEPALKSTLLAGETELSERKGSWRYDSESNGPASGSTAGDEPALYALADPAQADDLKRINGVGPKLEEQLNELGVHHFHQIAAWTSENAAWVDEKLSFRGRIERDDWIAQARELSAEQNTGAA
ncbi:hypothetical protein ACFORG_10885 [Lutimaribacter marinistellae]|uniref:NADH-quinone oxidoreductase subunit E n=1 Tax=Lutimaribacter marinistellae TaxID=1820329 RepID=A0ABV7TF82_9RHOB